MVDSRFYICYNSISFRSGWWDDDNERLSTLYSGTPYMVGNNLAYSWIGIWDCQISRPMLNLLSYWDSYARNKTFINLRRGSAMEWSGRRLRGVQTSCRHKASKSECKLLYHSYLYLCSIWRRHSPVVRAVWLWCRSGRKVVSLRLGFAMPQLKNSLGQTSRK